MAQWPVLYDRLLTWLPGVTGTTVYDGEALSGDESPTFITVGFVHGGETQGSFSQTRAGNGFQTEETGQVLAELYSGNGDGDLAAARTAAFLIVDAIQDAIVADQTLQALPQGSTVALTVEPFNLETRAGAALWLLLTFDYFTRSV